MLKQRLGLVLLLLFLALAPALSAAPLRVTGRILDLPRDRAAVVELRPLVTGYQDGVRLLAGDPVPPLATARPGPGGRFEMLVPESGIYRAGLRIDGFLPVEIQLVPLVEDTQLPPLRLEPASPVQVTVLGPAGKPAPGLRLRALPVRAFTASSELSWRPAQSEGVTDAEGRVTLPLQRGEDVSFVVLAPGVPDRFVQRVEAPRQTLRLTRTEPRVLEVRGADGKPAPNVLARWDFMPFGRTGEDGRLPLPAPTEGAFVRLEDARGQRAEVGILPTTPRSLPARLPGGGTATGRVLDAVTRQALPGALVWDAWHRPVRADAEGRYRLQMAGSTRPAGSLSAAAAGHVQGWRAVSPSDGDLPILLSPSASLTGRVTDEAGAAIAGAEVEANPAPGSNLSAATHSSAESDSGGYFRLAGLSVDNRYEVSAVRKGYAPSSVTASTPVRAATVPLRIVLHRGATAIGRIVDETGQAVAGAEVRLAPAHGFWTGFSKAERTTTSDSAGRFRFADLPGGSFDLQTTRTGFAPAGREGLEIPAEPRIADLGDVILAAGVSLEGRVTDRRNQPLAGASVSCNERTAEPWGRPSDQKRVVTGADGRFRIDDLQRGATFDLGIRKDGYAPADLPGVSAPAAEPLRVELAAARVLTGRVLGPSGEPVPGATISRFRMQEIQTEGRTASAMGGMQSLATADGDGRFRVADLDAGTLDLVVAARGYKSRKLSGVETREDDDHPLEITLEPGESVEGRLSDAQGNPVPGAMMFARPERPPLMLAGSQTAVSDSDGRYRLAGLDTGRCTIEAASPQGEAVSAKIDVQPGVNRLDLTFHGGTEVEGRVVDGTGAPVGGAWVQLRAAGGDAGRAATGISAADGSFHLRQVADGDYRISAGHQAVYAPSADTIHVAGSPVRGLELVLQRGAVLSGRLRGFAAEDRGSVHVLAIQREAPEGHPAFPLSGTLSGDTYRIAGLAPGTWAVTAESSSNARAQGTVVVEPGTDNVTLDLEAPMGLTLTGRVLLDKAPMSGARVFAQGVGGTAQRWPDAGETAYDGTFRFAGLAPGRYRLVVLGPGGLGLSREVDLQDDREVTIEVATGTLSGRVLTSAGQPVADALVSADGDDPTLGTGFSGPTARSDEQGAFALPPLVAGSYKITVTKPGFAPVASRVVVPPGGTVETQVVLKEAGGS